MIRALRQGMRVMLPSGNVLVLVRRDGGSWVCEYSAHSRQRGEVEFTSVYLRKWGMLVGIRI